MVLPTAADLSPAAVLVYSNWVEINDAFMVEKNLVELAQALAATSDVDLIEAFLRSLLTPAEAVDIAKRWALVKELDRKKTQREIAKSLGLSLCKITRGSRELKKPDSAFRKMLMITQAQNSSKTDTSSK